MLQGRLLRVTLRHLNRQRVVAHLLNRRPAIIGRFVRRLDQFSLQAMFAQGRTRNQFRRFTRPVDNSGLGVLALAPYKDTMNVRVIRRSADLVLLRVGADRSRRLAVHVTNVSRAQARRRALTVFNNLRLRLVRVGAGLVRLISTLLSLPRLVQARLINVDRHTPRQVMAVRRAITSHGFIGATQRRQAKQGVRRFTGGIHANRVGIMLTLTFHRVGLRVANFHVGRGYKRHMNITRRRRIQR